MLFPSTEITRRTPLLTFFPPLQKHSGVLCAGDFKSVQTAWRVKDKRPRAQIRTWRPSKTEASRLAYFPAPRSTAKRSTVRDSGKTPRQADWHPTRKNKKEKREGNHFSTTHKRYFFFKGPERLPFLPLSRPRTQRPGFPRELRRGCRRAKAKRASDEIVAEPPAARRSFARIRADLEKNRRASRCHRRAKTTPSPYASRGRASLFSRRGSFPLVFLIVRRARRPLGIPRGEPLYLLCVRAASNNESLFVPIVTPQSRRAGARHKG